MNADASLRMIFNTIKHEFITHGDSGYLYGLLLRFQLYLLLNDEMRYADVSKITERFADATYEINDFKDDLENGFYE